MVVIGALAAPTPGSCAERAAWVASWAQAMTSNYTCAGGDSPGAARVTCDPAAERAPSLHAATLREVVHASLGGDEVRIRLSNYFGQAPITVGAAHVALAATRDGGFAIAPASDRSLRFNGQAAATIAPGAMITSDPIALHVPASSALVVSLYFPDATPLADVHLMEHAATAALVPGNAVAAQSLRGRVDLTRTLGVDASHHVYALDEVDVRAPAGTRGIVAFGDSITDGAYATAPGDTWPGVLAGLAAAHGQHAAVINMGISGNELTVDQVGRPDYGVAALKRFERDVVDRAGVTDVVVLLGINDLNRGTDVAGFPNGASFGAIVAGYRMLIDAAHAHHLKIYGGTLTPIAGFPYPGWYSPSKEAIRERVNRWIRTAGAFDGVIDFSRELAGRYRPTALAARQDPLPPGLASVCAGDAGLHPNDRGYRVMGTHAYDELFGAHLAPGESCR